MDTEKFIEWKSGNLDWSLLLSTLSIVYYVVLDKLFNLSLPDFLCQIWLTIPDLHAQALYKEEKIEITNVKTFSKVKVSFTCKCGGMAVL